MADRPDDPEGPGGRLGRDREPLGLGTPRTARPDPIQYTDARPSRTARAGDPPPAAPESDPPAMDQAVFEQEMARLDRMFEESKRRQRREEIHRIRMGFAKDRAAMELMALMYLRDGYDLESAVTMARRVVKGDPSEEAAPDIPPGTTPEEVELVIRLVKESFDKRARQLDEEKAARARVTQNRAARRARAAAERKAASGRTTAKPEATAGSAKSSLGSIDDGLSPVPDPKPRPSPEAPPSAEPLREDAKSGKDFRDQDLRVFETLFADATLRILIKVGKALKVEQEKDQPPPGLGPGAAGENVLPDRDREERRKRRRRIMNRIEEMREARLPVNMLGSESLDPADERLVELPKALETLFEFTPAGTFADVMVNFIDAKKALDSGDVIEAATILGVTVVESAADVAGARSVRALIKAVKDSDKGVAKRILNAKITEGTGAWVSKLVGADDSFSRKLLTSALERAFVKGYTPQGALAAATVAAAAGSIRKTLIGGGLRKIGGETFEALTDARRASLRRLIFNELSSSLAQLPLELSEKLQKEIVEDVVEELFKDLGRAEPE